MTRAPTGSSSPPSPSPRPRSPQPRSPAQIRPTPPRPGCPRSRCPRSGVATSWSAQWAAVPPGWREPVYRIDTAPASEVVPAQPPLSHRRRRGRRARLRPGRADAAGPGDRLVGLHLLARGPAQGRTVAAGLDPRRDQPRRPRAPHPHWHRPGQHHRPDHRGDPAPRPGAVLPAQRRRLPSTGTPAQHHPPDRAPAPAGLGTLHRRALVVARHLGPARGPADPATTPRARHDHTVKLGGADPAWLREGLRFWLR